MVNDGGAVVHGANGSPTATSEYEHSSIVATVKKLYNLPNFLTQRDQWAATFEGILQTRTEPRTDCPGMLYLILSHDNKLQISLLYKEFYYRKFG